MARDVDREAEAADPGRASPAPFVASLAPVLQASGVSWEAALARAVAGRAAVSNRGVGRVLARETTDWPIINPWTGEPEDMSQFKTTEMAAAPAASDPGPAAQSSKYGAVLRAEIIKWLEKFAPAPSLEGKGTGFDELHGAGGRRRPVRATGTTRLATTRRSRSSPRLRKRPTSRLASRSSKSRRSARASGSGSSIAPATSGRRSSRRGSRALGST